MSSLNSCEIRCKFFAFVNNWIKAVVYGSVLEALVYLGFVLLFLFCFFYSEESLVKFHRNLCWIQFCSIYFQREVTN